MKINTSPQEDIINIRPELGFTIVHKINDNPDTLEFRLHNHDDIYEIMLFLGGDCEFEVEGNTYKIKPHDIVLTRPFELHHIMCLSHRRYDRIILYIKADYFTRHGCERYLDIFENRELGTGNIICSDFNDGAPADCMQRMMGYYSRGIHDVATALITEFLYLINNTNRTYDYSFSKNERIRDIIVYINNHITENLRLDDISRRFFIDKSYLCKSFKKSTGFTVNRYINYKRILLVQELHRRGETLLRASMEAGFGSYGHFYKMYVKQTGKPPKSMN